MRTMPQLSTHVNVIFNILTLLHHANCAAISVLLLSLSACTIGSQKEGYRQIMKKKHLASLAS